MSGRLNGAASTVVDHSMIDAAVAALRASELVIYPTETFYGIAADPQSPAALERIFALKGRQAGKPIALIAGDTFAAFALAREIPPLAQRLAAAFWPGPLTIVMPARPGLHQATLGPCGVGVRVSSHRIARALASGFGRPITASSANLSGQAPIADPAIARAVLGVDIKVILEDGILSGGAPSTVIELADRGYRIVREGAISAAAIVAAIGRDAAR